MSSSTTQTIEIVVNGLPRGVPGGLNLREVLAALDVAPDRVAVEMNRLIVRKPAWSATVVTAGAVLEIVQFVGGG